MSPDQAIARVASRQHGLFTRGQAIDCHFSTSAIERRIASGRWIACYRGVYALAGAPSTYERKVMAAVLHGGDGAAASHRTAGTLFKIEGIERGTVEIVVPRSRRVRTDDFIPHHVDIPPSDVGKILGIPVTTPYRTILDLASLLDRDDLEDSLHDIVRRKLVDPRKLEARLKSIARKRFPGSGVLLQVVHGLTTENVSGSNRENRVRRALTRAGLPEPVRQFKVYDENGVFVARPDLSYPDRRLYIEYDGDRHNDPRRREIDRDRQNRLSGVGWRPLTFTKDDFKKPLSLMVARVRRALDAG